MGQVIATIEAADIRVAEALAPIGKSRLGGAICAAGKLGDQPPLRVLALAMLGAGAIRGDGRLARTAFRMLAAHTLATEAKNLIKRRVDRTRPKLLIEEGRYEAKPGDSEDHEETSFPSGHTAGLVAMAAAFGREYPEHAPKALGAAGVLAALQLPKAAHYLSDIVAGAAIGWASEAAVRAVWPTRTPG